MKSNDYLENIACIQHLLQDKKLYIPTKKKTKNNKKKFADLTVTIA